MASDSQQHGPVTGMFATKVVDVRFITFGRLATRVAPAERRPAKTGTGTVRVPAATFDASL